MFYGYCFARSPSPTAAPIHFSIPTLYPAPPPNCTAIPTPLSTLAPTRVSPSTLVPTRIFPSAPAPTTTPTCISNRTPAATCNSRRFKKKSYLLCKKSVIKSWALLTSTHTTYNNIVNGKNYL